MVTNSSCRIARIKNRLTTRHAKLSLAANCSVTITFTPGAKGKRTAVLSIYDNDGYQVSPQAESLIGTGT
jgi:hypothetical protein